MKKKAAAASPHELPLLGNAPQERADATRNRRKILAAAERLTTEQGIENLSMDEVAAAAGVGVGTVYRRFGDRSGLAYALLDDGEREFQEAFLRGPPPLGPGAEPVARVRAFLHAWVDRLERQTAMLLIAHADTPFARFSSAYAVHHAHLSMLIAHARPEAHAHYLADALLAALDAPLFIRQRREMDTDDIKSGLEDLLATLSA